MAKTDALVDLVGSLPSAMTAAPGRGHATVSFRGGRSARLDLSLPQAAVWAEVLAALQGANAPAYVEIEPGTGLISTLLVPIAVRVGEITPIAGDDAVEVELIISHARHVLRRANPDFDRLLAELRAARDSGATVAVTETPTGHDIIDVRPWPGTPPLGAVPEPSAPTEDAPVGAAVTPGQAQQMFDLVNARICCPAMAAAPCITFSFPDDGCWGRAHEMCRLMIAAGIQPDKVWIYGSLRAPTQNHPACAVRWGWHVAPTLTVGTASGPQVQVIDPSLFPGPVPQANWAGVQGDQNAVLIPSAATVFYRDQGGSIVETDPTYAKTNQVLNTYRQQLRLRAVGPDGPPPYAACLPARPGVQWVGALAGGATGVWFTFGWPAAWHVVWTIMPLTACPGGPQLSWRTRVERASAAQATYWIVVRNLTPNTVRFEGRYDVLSR